MSTLPLQRHALAGGPVDGFIGPRRRMSRPAVVLSIVVHLAVLVAASQWYAPGPAPNAINFEWLTVIEPPSAPVVEAAVEVAQPLAPVVAPAPPRATPRPASPPVVVPPQPEAPAEAPSVPVGPSRLELDSARRAAAAAVVEQHARDGSVRAPSVDDVPPPQPRPAPGPRKPSIFDHQAASGRSFMQPGKQRSVAGQKLSLWCNKVSGGGFGFFGIPVCRSQGIQPPSGIFADSIPEYMKLKPECEETQPLAATLGETSAYPTMKCRLVPKDPDE